MVDKVEVGDGADVDPTGQYASAADQTPEQRKKAAQILGHFDYLVGSRANWMTHWREVMHQCNPRKEDVWVFNVGGEKRAANITDTTGQKALELLASALQSMLTNPSIPWFELSTGDYDLDRNDMVRKWLQETNRLMFNVFNGSNFQSEVHEYYLDLLSLGTGVLLVEEDDKFVVRFQARPIYEAYIAENNKSIVDTIYRSYKWHARQIRQEFGEENIPKFLVDKLRSNMLEKFEVIQAIYPREDYDNSGLAQNFKFASCWILRVGQFILRESGYMEFPYIVSRWSKISAEVYGRSPAMVCLPDMKMIQQMKNAIIEGAQKTINPPMLLPNEGVIRPFKFIPGGINYVKTASQADMIKPLVSGMNVNIGFDMLKNIQTAIREAFYVDQLQLNEGPQMTATEVQQRTEEKLRLMGPVLGRQHHEFLRPLIDRVFNVMMRKGMIKNIPGILRGRSIKVHYSSMIARVQEQTEGANVQKIMNLIAPMAQANPSIMDNIDFDATTRFLMDVYGMPEDIMRDTDAIIKLRQNRVQQQQQQQQQMQQAQQAQNAKNVAPLVQATQQTA